MTISRVGIVFASVLLGVSVQAENVESWVKEALTYPFVNHPAVHGLDKGGLPTYLGQNSAEACPERLKFTCSHCTGNNCDRDWPKGKRTDSRPCKGGNNKACHNIPRTSDTKVCWKCGDPLHDADLGAESLNVTVGMAPMKDREILQRALGWLVSNFEYKWDKEHLKTKTIKQQPTSNFEGCADSKTNTKENCPAKRYLSDCSGFVAMAWKTDCPCPKPSHFTRTDVADTISCRNLKPGDVIVTPSKGHVMMFRQWDNRDKLTFSGWQMGGDGEGKANHFQGRVDGTCHARKNIVRTGDLSDLLV